MERMIFGKSEKKVKISVIICAYNEEKYLGQTLKDVLKCATADEVIVVNDGSTDKTKQVAEKFKDKIKLISYPKNQGKGYALSKGVQAAKGKIIVMLDADLKNFNENHLQKMVRPIIKRETNYVLAYPHKKSTFIVLTGQRAYLKDLLVPHLSSIKKSRFGLETYLNDIYKTRWGKTIKLRDLSYYSKGEKTNGNDAFNQYLQEIIEISKVKAEIQLAKYQRLKNILSQNEIDSIHSLRKSVKEIKDKEVSQLVEEYVLPYLKKINQE